MLEHLDLDVNKEERREVSLGTRDPENKNVSLDEPLSDPGYGWRHIQILLMFSAVFGLYVNRSCMAVALVAMTEEITPGQEVFTWSREQQGTILGAFLWGYAFTQVPAGYLTTRFGTKRLMGTSLLLSSIILLCVPIVSRQFGWIGLTVLRVLTGLVQGTTYPGTFTLLGQWAVPQERGRAAAIATVANPGGIFAAMALSGVIAVNLGWQSIFYFFSCFTFAITILWFIFSADNPTVHPRISDKERSFILGAIGKECKASKVPTPWRAIFTSVPFFALTLAHIGYVWGLWLLLTALPRYMNDVFDFSLSLNGVISGIPYLLTVVVGLLSGCISDIVIERKIASTGFVRRFSNCIGFWVPAILLIALTLTPNDQKWIQIVELTLSVGLVGAINSGFMVNFVELSPRFSGLIMSISNCVGSVTSAVAPPIIGVFISALGETKGWNASFYLTAGIFFVTNLIWLLLGSTEQQPWNDVQVEQALEEDIKNKTRTKNGGIEINTLNSVL